MILDGCAGSMAVDSSGEVLDVRGAALDDYYDQKAYVNWEHKSGSDGDPNNIVGKIVFAKKIYSQDDCEDQRQLLFWKKLEVPYIYIRCELFDEAGHPGATALAAIIRHELSTSGQVNVQFSVEGTTLERDGQLLKKTVLRGVALTCRAANKSSHVGLLQDKGAPKHYPTSGIDLTKPPDTMLATAKFEDPLNSILARGTEMLYTSEDLQSLRKTTTAGGTNSAPGTLTNGASLQAEDPSLRENHIKSQILAFYRDWDGKGKFKDLVKNKLPDISDEFLEYFEQILNKSKLKLKKAILDTVVGGLVKHDCPVDNTIKMDWLHTDKPQQIDDNDPQHFATLHTVLRNPVTPKDITHEHPHDNEMWVEENPNYHPAEPLNRSEELALKLQSLSVELNIFTEKIRKGELDTEGE